MYNQANICLLTSFSSKNTKLNGIFPSRCTSSSKYFSNTVT